MIFEVINWDIHVGTMKINAVASSSFVLIGDTNTIQLASFFDTPPDALLIGTFVPFVSQG